MDQVPSAGFDWITYGMGVGSSATVVVVLWLLRAAKEKVVREWKQRLAEEQLIDLSKSKWQGDRVEKDGYSYSEVLTLNQNGMTVEGTLEYTEEPGTDTTKNAKKSFHIQGLYREGSLTAFYRSKDRSSTSSGCLTMHLESDNRFHGGCVYYDGEAHAVVHDPYGFNRLP